MEAQGTGICDSLGWLGVDGKGKFLDWEDGSVACPLIGSGVPMLRKATEETFLLGQARAVAEGLEVLGSPRRRGRSTTLPQRLPGLDPHSLCL